MASATPAAPAAKAVQMTDAQQAYWGFMCESRVDALIGKAKDLTHVLRLAFGSEGRPTAHRDLSPDEQVALDTQTYQLLLLLEMAEEQLDARD